jgi:predicted double-glycine peptidase
MTVPWDRSMPIRITWIPLALLLSLALAGTISSTAGAASAERRSAVKSLLEMRRQNVVLQQWDLSCAAAALATILRYQHGEVVTERSVALGLIDREEYIANPYLVRLRQGFSLLDLKRFVDELGYLGIGLGQLDLPDLLERAPIIVPVHLQGYPHFVIFRGTLGNSVLLADPAFGNLTLSVEKFMAGWIYYRDIGRVGFLVTETGTPAPPGRLSASALDFVLLRP